MSDTPFGFGPADRDKDRDKDRDRKDRESGSGGSSEGPADPFGFGMGGLPGMPGGFSMPGMPGGPGGGNFDMGQLGQMFSQLGQMLSQAGTSSGPVNYDLAKQIAVQQLTSSSRPTAEQRKAVEDAFSLAELWLDPVTAFPTGTRTVAAWSPKDWVDASMPTWQKLCDPVAQRVSGAWLEGLPDEAKQAAGPMLAMLGQMGGLTFGSQLGAGLAQLGTEMLSSTDVGIPLAPPGTAALLPAAVEAFTTGLDRPSSEVMVFLAAREAAHLRLFAHAPWLTARVISAVEEYARGIRVDTSRIEEIARQIDPNDPRSIEGAMQSGLFEPPKTQEQFTALGKLEALLALIEGWVDVVVSDALGDRLPGAEALRETLRRRRASGGPAEQTFATLVGLELRPRQLQSAAHLWRRITEERGQDARDEIWSHWDFLPTEVDLDNPEAYLSGSLIGDDTDPIAEIARAEAAEKAAGKQTPSEDEQSKPKDEDPPVEK